MTEKPAEPEKDTFQVSEDRAWLLDKRVEAGKAEDVVLLQADEGQVFYVLRTSLTALAGSWFAERFTREAEKKLSPLCITKEGRRVHLLPLDNGVLHALLALLAHPALIEDARFCLPHNVRYQIDLKEWQYYLHFYLREHAAPLGARDLLKRKRVEEQDEETKKAKKPRLGNPDHSKDLSEPPLRYKREHGEWEFLIAFLGWLFAGHPEASKFRDAECNELRVMISSDQVLPFLWPVAAPAAEDRKLIGLFPSSRLDAMKASMQRILQNRPEFDLQCLVKFLARGRRDSLTAYGGPLYGSGRDRLWPYKDERYTEEVLVMELEWENWDGHSD